MTVVAAGRYCTGCGMPLGDPCCGFVNPAGARFCAGCGRLRQRPSEHVVDSATLEVEDLLGEAALELIERERRERSLHHFDQGELDQLFGVDRP
ncbi:MAG: hypothetical protein ACYTF0_09035 [Planctomycetota bacterium]